MKGAELTNYSLPVDGVASITEIKKLLQTYGHTFIEVDANTLNNLSILFIDYYLHDRPDQNRNLISLVIDGRKTKSAPIYLSTSSLLLAYVTIRSGPPSLRFGITR